MSAPRRHVATVAGALSTRAVFVSGDGLEIEDHQAVEIRIGRVLWDEVLRVTLHRETAAFALAASAVPGLGFPVVGILIATSGDALAGVIVGAIGLPFAVLAAWFALRPVPVVTVFGRRITARIPFHFRHSRARTLFDEVAARAAAAQRAPAPPP